MQEARKYHLLFGDYKPYSPKKTENIFALHSFFSTFARKYEDKTIQRENSLHGGGTGNLRWRDNH